MKRFALAMLGALATAFLLAPQTASADTLTDIQSRGKVIVGTQFQFPNWGFYDDKREAAGFDIDVARLMAKAMGVEVEFVETQSPNRIPYLQTNKVDLVISVFSITPERALRVGFTRPYGVLMSVMFSKKGDGINSVADLKGKTVAVTKGTGSADRIRAAAPDATFLEFDTPTDTFLAVQQGKADAGAQGFDGVATFIKENPDFEVKGDPLAPHFLVAIGTRQEDHALLRWLDTWLMQMENDGVLDELYVKWFGVPLPEIKS